MEDLCFDLRPRRANLNEFCGLGEWERARLPPVLTVVLHPVARSRPGHRPGRHNPPMERNSLSVPGRTGGSDQPLAGPAGGGCRFRPGTGRMHRDPETT